MTSRLWAKGGEPSSSVVMFCTGDLTEDFGGSFRPELFVFWENSSRLLIGIQGWISQPYPLHFVEREPLLRAVIELGGARALVRRHGLRVFERAAVGEIGRDPGRAE
jgi:hypothetical protein